MIVNSVVHRSWKVRIGDVELANLVFKTDVEATRLEFHIRKRLAAEANLGFDRMALLEIAIHDAGSARRREFAIGARTIALRDVAKKFSSRRPAVRHRCRRRLVVLRVSRSAGRSLDAFDEDVGHAQAKKWNGRKIRLLRQRRSADIAALRKVDLFIQARVDQLHPEARHDRETTKVETVLGEDGEIRRFALAQIAQHAVVGERRVAALVGALLERVVKINTAREGRSITRQLIVVPQARINALTPHLPILHGIRVRGATGRDRSKTTAALPSAPAREIPAKSRDIQLRRLREILLILEAAEVAGQAKLVELPRDLVPAFFVIDAECPARWDR